MTGQTAEPPTTPPRIGSLFSGCGGLDIGVRAALGGGTACWHAEHYRPARAVLRAHFPEVTLYDDIGAVAWPEAAPVDVLVAGFPCQKLSLLGRREGLRPGEAAHLFGQASGWDLTVRVIDTTRPALVILENVSALLTAPVTDGSAPGSAFGAILADLATLGFNAEWTCADASAIGAPHRRRRVFIAAAHPERLRFRPWWNRPQTGGTGQLRWHDPAGSAGLDHGTAEPLRQRHGDALDRWAAVIGRPAPHPVLNRTRNPEFWGWMMGLPPGWLTPAGMPAALRVAGNAVVPHQAHAAVADLLDRHRRQMGPRPSGAAPGPPAQTWTHSVT